MQLGVFVEFAPGRAEHEVDDRKNDAKGWDREKGRRPLNEGLEGGWLRRPKLREGLKGGAQVSPSEPSLRALGALDGLRKASEGNVSAERGEDLMKRRARA